MAWVSAILSASTPMAAAVVAICGKMALDCSMVRLPRSRSTSKALLVSTPTVWPVLFDSSSSIGPIALRTASVVAPTLMAMRRIWASLSANARNERRTVSTAVVIDTNRPSRDMVESPTRRVLRTPSSANAFRLARQFAQSTLTALDALVEDTQLVGRQSGLLPYLRQAGVVGGGRDLSHVAGLLGLRDDLVQIFRTAVFTAFSESSTKLSFTIWSSVAIAASPNHSAACAACAARPRATGGSRAMRTARMASGRALLRRSAVSPLASARSTKASSM